MSNSKNIKVYIGSILIALFFINRLFAQNFMVTNYTENDGLPSSMVYDVVQDEKGTIWFATRIGISKYDGYQWLSYSLSDGLPMPSYFKIQADKEGTVWALSYPPNIFLSYFQNDEWHSIEFPERSSLNSKATCFRIAEINSEKYVIFGTKSNGLYFYKNNNWEHIQVEDGLLDANVQNIEQFNNELYIATAKGISIFDGKKINNNYNSDVKIPDEMILGMAIEKKSGSFPVMWLVGEHWIGIVENNEFSYIIDSIRIVYDQPNEYVLIEPDEMGGAYIGNPLGIFHINRKTKKIINLDKNNGLITTGASSILIDDERNVWVTSYRGASKITSLRFANFQKESGLLENEVTAIVESKRGEYIFGHNTGLTFYNGATCKLLDFSKNKNFSSTETRVLDLSLDKTGNLWIAANKLGLGKLNLELDSLQWLGNGYQVSGEVHSVLVDNSDNVWISNNYGLQKLIGDKFKNVHPEKYSHAMIRKIFQDKNNNILCATKSNGILYLKNGEWQNYRSHEEKSYNSVFSILTDSKGRVWVGTIGGLCRLEHNKIQKVNFDNYDFNRPVYLIVEDSENRLWFGTNNGVIRWDGHEFSEFTVYDGFVGQETNRSAGIVDSEGHVWIGTDLGVSCYLDDFDFDISLLPAPKLELEYLQLGTGNVPFADDVNLSYTENNLLFKFKAVSFIDEKKVSYQVKLEGFEKEWSHENPFFQRQAIYSNIPPGRYRFHVRAKNAYGKWSPVVSSSQIIIHNPFWREWWFYLIIISVLVIVIIALFMRKYLVEKNYSSELEQQVQHRTAQLAESEKRYRQMFENNQAVILIVNQKTGMIVNANPAACRFYGQELEQMRQLEFNHFNLTPVSIQDLIETNSEHDIDKTTNIILQQKTAFNEIKDIEIFFYQTVITDETLFYLFIQDVTERIKAVKALEENEEKYRELVNTTIDGVISVDSKMEVILWNKAAEKIFGYQESEIIGNSIILIVPERYREQKKDGFFRFRKLGRGEILGKTLELTGLRKDGVEIPVELSVSSRLVGDDLIATAIIRDITERKQSEKNLQAAKEAAESANKAKSLFLATMSHEIRTPMNGIIGFLDLILEKNLSAEQYQYLTMVKNSADQLLSLINDILDFSKIEAGQMSLEKIDFDLRTTIESVGDVVIQKVEEKGLELNLFIAKDVPINLIGDPVRLRQILINLLGNAVKFTEEGEINIKVELKEIVDKNIKIQFSVADSGIGIPKERQDAIFESFTQVDNSTTRKYGGTGLGLTISQKLINMMGGRIWVESDEGSGSCFKFICEFPVQENPEDQKIILPTDIRGIKVLALDSNMTNRFILNEMLKSFGVNPLVMDDSEQALKAVETKNDFEMIISDYNMPDMNSKLFISRLREKNRKIPVILLTTVGKNSEVSAIEELGSIWTLTKPVKQSYLFDAIIMAMGKSDYMKKNFEDDKADLDRNIVMLKSINRDVKILLAEDNIVNQKVASALVKKVDIPMDIVDDGKHAISLLRRNPVYDLILMDVQMPLIDGIRATQIIREKLDIKTIPIIAMTAYAMKGDKEKCLNAGMNDYISKPIEPKELFRILVKWLIDYKVNALANEKIPESLQDGMKR